MRNLFFILSSVFLALYGVYVVVVVVGRCIYQQKRNRMMKNMEDEFYREGNVKAAKVDDSTQSSVSEEENIG